jgi:hypothetical protein
MLVKVSKRLSLILFTATSIGCGGMVEDDKDSPDTIVELQPGASQPAAFSLEDPSCQVSATSASLSTTEIYRWAGDVVESHNVELEGVFNSPNGLQSPAVNKTTYLDTWIRECDPNKPRSSRCLNSRGQTLPWSFSPEESKGVLKVCDPGKSYGRRTYESMALSAIYYVGNAHDTYQEITGDDTLAKIQLSVSPLFIDEYVFPVSDGVEKRQREYLTHNMAYFPRNGDIPYGSIAVFPERDSFEEHFPGYFWESEFALGHEYGHHIDLSKSKTYYESIGLYWNTLTHSFTDHEIQNGAPALDSGGTTRSKIHDAVQEGFADLMAFYSAGGTSKSLVGIECLGGNRDVANSSFANSEEKILTEDRFDMFLGKAEDTNSACEPHYDNHHTIGAILAHSANSFFSKLTAASPETKDHEKDIEQRYLLTLKWLDAFKSASLQLKDTNSDLERLTPVTQAFEQVADEWLTTFGLTGTSEEKDLRANLCQVVADFIPASPSKPFSSPEGSCL